MWFGGQSDFRLAGWLADWNFGEQLAAQTLLYFQIEEQDSKEDIDWLCKKIVNLRIFPDENDVMNLSVKDRCHKIFDKVEDVYYKLDYQEEVFNKIFNVKTKLNIIQYLDLDTKMFARISYLLLLNYVWNRLPNIIQQLEKPVVLENELYLTLANDSLEQLKVVFETGFFIG